MKKYSFCNILCAPIFRYFDEIENSVVQLLDNNEVLKLSLDHKEK